MPLTRIAISRDDFTHKQAIISDTLQQCLEQHFDVPAHDCFQLFDVYDPGHRTFDTHYPALNSPRSDGWLLFQITAGRHRNLQQKQSFCQALSRNLQNRAGIRSADIMVIIQFNQPEDWSFAAGYSYSFNTGENQ